MTTYPDTDSRIGNFDEVLAEPDAAVTNITSDLSAYTIDRTTVAHFVALYGSAVATDWLEFDRYRIWQAPFGVVPESSFPPIQGYMQHKSHIFAWGNP
ncbi:hypothetical protein MPER_08313, partial [Moniliophthora perniciosa FA553]